MLMYELLAVMNHLVYIIALTRSIEDSFSDSSVVSSTGFEITGFKWAN